MGRFSTFLAELKRRNVLRAVVLYIGAVWALSQGISQLSGPLGLANWVTVWFPIACAIAFPFWIAFAWFYEFTPHGFKRESEVAVDTPQRHTNARKLDLAIIGVLVNLAKIEAQLGHADKAVPILDALVSTDHGGTISIATVRTDVDVDPIRNAPEFKQLLQKYAGVQYNVHD